MKLISILGEVDVVKVLIENDVDDKARNKDGQTPFESLDIVHKVKNQIFDVFRKS